MLRARLAERSAIPLPPHRMLGCWVGGLGGTVCFGAAASSRERKSVPQSLAPPTPPAKIPLPSRDQQPPQDTTLLPPRLSPAPSLLQPPEPTCRANADQTPSAFHQTLLPQRPVPLSGTREPHCLLWQTPPPSARRGTSDAFHRIRRRTPPPPLFLPYPPLQAAPLPQGNWERQKVWGGLWGCRLSRNQRQQKQQTTAAHKRFSHLLPQNINNYTHKDAQRL